MIIILWFQRYKLKVYSYRDDVGSMIFKNNHHIDLSIHEEMASINVVAIDLDGVVYEGKQLIQGASEAIDQLHKMGLKIFFITNNSARSLSSIEGKLKGLGLDINNGDVISSITAVINLLTQITKKGCSKLFILGSEECKNEIAKAGFNIVSTPDCDYLVVGFDSAFNYEKISLGLDAINNGAKFIALNREANFPEENGHLNPGCGVMVSAIEASSNHSPDFIAGKPEPIMLEILSARLQCRPEEILVIGDRIESDILMANRFGALSGWVTREKKVCSANIAPTFSIKSLSELPEIIRPFYKGKVNY